jgi:transposase
MPARPTADPRPPHPAPPLAMGHNGGPPLDADVDQRTSGAPQDHGPPAEIRRRPGRPTVATPELVEAILDRLSEGEPLRAICRAAGMPGRGTVYRWRRADPEFDRACEFMQEEGYCHLLRGVVEEVDRLVELRGARAARAWFNRRRQRLVRQAPRRLGGG